MMAVMPAACQAEQDAPCSAGRARSSASTLRLNPQSSWMEGVTHYRLIPGAFPTGVEYHFDGLASVLAFRFRNGSLSLTSRAYQSGAAKHWKECIFFASGSGPTAGVLPCLKNPLVNLLPIQGQLWLTIDTNGWGRVDPDTLQTLDAARAVHLSSNQLPRPPARPLAERALGQASGARRRSVHECALRLNCAVGARSVPMAPPVRSLKPRPHDAA